MSTTTAASTLPNPLEMFFGLLFKITLKPQYCISDDDSKNNTRIINGYLLAVDNDGNLLLNQSQEIIKNENHEIINHRFLGMLSIPNLTIEKIEVQKEKYERALKYETI